MKKLLIGELAKETGVCPMTIRRYLKRGLINKPEKTWCGWMIFTQEHVRQIKRLTGKHTTDGLSGAWEKTLEKELDALCCILKEAMNRTLKDIQSLPQKISQDLSLEVKNALRKGGIPNAKV